MNKKKTIIIIRCICTLLILLIVAFVTKYVFSIWENKQAATKQEKVSFYEDYTGTEIEWMGVAEDGISTCVVENVGYRSISILPGEGVFFTNRCGVEINFGVDYNEYLLKEYQIENGTQGRIVDITKVIDQYPDYLINSLSKFYNINGQDYVRVCIYVRADEGETIIEYDGRGSSARKYIYMNIDNGEMFEGKSNQFSDMLMWDLETLFDNVEFLKENISEGFAGRYYNSPSTTGFTGKANGCFEIDIEAIDLPHQNKELYSLFPELKNYIGQEGYYIHLVIGNSPSAEYLLRLLMEDGKEISFEHMEPIPNYQSIDGQEHEVHSFEEYYQWKDIYWRDR